MRLAPLEDTLRAWIKEQPDLTLAEMRARLAKEGMAISMGGLWQQLDRWKLAFKKKPCAPVSRTGRMGRSG